MSTIRIMSMSMKYLIKRSGPTIFSEHGAETFL
jgi:hypothetical protein